MGLTPPRGRGQRQISEEATLQEAIAKVLKTHHVEDFLTVTYDRQVRQQRKYVGRGRGAAHRSTQVIEKVRYQLTAVIRQKAQIAAQHERFGWKAFAANAPKHRLSPWRRRSCAIATKTGSNGSLTVSRAA